MKYLVFTALSIGLFSTRTWCMEKKDKSIIVKLAEDQSFHHLHPTIAKESSVIDEKLHWKKYFNNHLTKPVDPKKPIVLSNVSSADIHSFGNIACMSKDALKAHYESLSRGDRINLINLTGPAKLHVPRLITFLVQICLKEDIEKSIISLIPTEEIAEYLKDTILQHNLSMPEIKGFGIPSSQCDFAFHPHGTFHAIPQRFQSGINYTTMGTTICRFMYIKNSDEKEIGRHHVISTKKINNCRYHVTHDRTNNMVRFWEIKNIRENEDSIWTYHESADISCKTYGSETSPITYFCPDNNYAFLITGENNVYKTIVIPLIHESQDITAHYLPDSLEKFVDYPKFNNKSTIFAFLSHNETVTYSQLLLYNIATRSSKKIIYNGCAGVAFCFNHDDTQLYVAIAQHNNPPCIFMYNMNDSALWDQATDIQPLVQIPIEKEVESLTITGLVYDKKRNQVIAQARDGDLILISEAIKGVIEKTVLHNPCEKIENSGSLLCFLDSHDILFSCPPFDPYIMFWDLKANNYIGQKKIEYSKKGLKNVVIAADECSFCTFNGFAFSWNQQMLWTPEEQKAIEYIRSLQSLSTHDFSLYQAYMLYRLYMAHKNQHSMTLHSGGAVAQFLDTLPTEPDTKDCIKKYLIIKKSNRELIQEAADNAIETIDDFVDNSIIPFGGEVMEYATQMMNGFMARFK